MLQAKVMSGLNQPEQAVAQYSFIRDQLLRLASRSAGESTVNKESSQVCYHMAELYEHRLRDLEKAASYYHEAYQFDPSFKKASLSLAKIQTQKSDFTGAQSQLTALLQEDEWAEEASLIMADLMCQQLTFSTAAFHYRQIIEKNPLHFEALANYIDACSRIGELEKVEDIFQVVEKSKRSKMEAGYIYCRGIYLRKLNKINDAMKQFVLCRKDAIWGERATFHLVELFLNPSDSTLGGEALNSATDVAPEAPKDWSTDPEFVGILTADQLIKELPKNPRSLRITVLESHGLMATKQKADIEKAIGNLMDVLTIDRDYIPALYVL